MLTLVTPKVELWQEDIQTFSIVESETLHLEHCLHAIALWESKWHKPFFSEKDKTPAEVLDYVRCMCLEPPKDPRVLSLQVIGGKPMNQINAYINDPMTATTFREDAARGKRELITAEIIYYWMTACNIPFECEYWHLNRLFTLVKVCSIKNSPGKKMGKNDIYKQNAALNKARRARHRSKG